MSLQFGAGYETDAFFIANAISGFVFGGIFATITGAVAKGEAAAANTYRTARTAGRARIRELEAELAATKLASELFAQDRLVRPKDIYPIVTEVGEAGHSLKASCRLLRVAPSGFFQWKFAPPSDRAIRRALLSDLIIKIWHESRQTYGKRRIVAELADAHGLVVNHKLVRSIMREHAISGLPKRKKFKPSESNRYTTSDLVNRDFDRDGSNQLWMTDITEHPTREGTLYCCATRCLVAQDGWLVD